MDGKVLSYVDWVVRRYLLMRVVFPCNTCTGRSDDGYLWLGTCAAGTVRVGKDQHTHHPSLFGP